MLPDRSYTSLICAARLCITLKSQKYLNKKGINTSTKGICNGPPVFLRLSALRVYALCLLSWIFICPDYAVVLVCECQRARLCVCVLVCQRIFPQYELLSLATRFSAAVFRIFLCSSVHSWLLFGTTFHKSHKRIICQTCWLGASSGRNPGHGRYY